MGNWKLYEVRQTHAPVKNTRPPPGATTPSVTNPPTAAATLDYLDMPGYAQKKSLYFNHCNTTFLPLQLGLVFPHVNSIFVYNSGLEELHPAIFESMQDRLVELGFQDNLIPNLTVTPFPTMPGVKKLNLAFNRIKVVAVDLLSRMNSLETFLINSNLIEVLPAGFFDQNQSLKFVNFNNNKIKSILYKFENYPPNMKLLGMGNKCTSFFVLEPMTNVKQAEMVQLVKDKCTLQVG